VRKAAYGFLVLAAIAVAAAGCAGDRRHKVAKTRLPQTAVQPVRTPAPQAVRSPASLPPPKGPASPAPLRPIVQTYILSKTGENDLESFRQLLATACSDPNRYQQLKTRIDQTSRNLDAAATALVYATRNKFMVTKTDLQIYEAYYADRCEMGRRMAECAQGVAMSAEQACDCGAGYVGAARYGAGAGEVIADAYARTAAPACRAAADRATGPERARYLAQLGRTQIKQDFSGAQATLQRAIDAGFRRAEIDQARNVLHMVETSSVLTPLALLQGAKPYLARAWAAGSREVGPTLESFDQLSRVRKLNYDFARAWADMMR
jgi:hypothetical protein